MAHVYIFYISLLPGHFLCAPRRQLFQQLGYHEAATLTIGNVSCVGRPRRGAAFVWIPTNIAEVLPANPKTTRTHLRTFPQLYFFLTGYVMVITSKQNSD